MSALANIDIDSLFWGRLCLLWRGLIFSSGLTRAREDHGEIPEQEGGEKKKEQIGSGGCNLGAVMHDKSELGLNKF